MINFRFFYLKTSKKNILAFLIILILINLLLSRIVAFLDLAIYDFNFLIRPLESSDERIVIVGWDETSIQSFKESIISDDTLTLTLKKIIQQQPRIVGLDLYRDIPVFSPRLSDQNNLKAYNSLQNLFRDSSNIIGIQKVIKPLVNPPKILSQKEFVAASDIPSDRDLLIRRTFVFPEETKSGQPAGIPYLGVALGFQYLSAEGWNAVPEQDNARTVKILNGKKSITLKSLKNFAGISQGDHYGYDFLINWRKAYPPFKKVSVIDVLSDRIEPELFNDRIVIIGNISASTADRHYVPLNRWKPVSSVFPSFKPQTTDEHFPAWIYGVEIPAQVASSIISASLDQRCLITPISNLNKVIILLISIFLILKYAERLEYLNIGQIYLKYLTYVATTSLFLLSLNLFSFSQGIWIPVALPFLNIWMSYFILCYYFYWKKNNENIARLQAYVLDLNHSLGYPLSSITNSKNRIKLKTEELGDFLSENLPGISSQSLDDIGLILKRIANIETQVEKIKRYRKRLGDFVEFTYLGKTNILVTENVNLFVEQVVERFINDSDYNYHVDVYTTFDPLITQIKFDPIAIEIVLQNLLANAFYAVDPQIANPISALKPTVEIKTLLKNQYVQFSVKDNGVGIPRHLYDEIFKPFKSFNNSQGIGLYLCRTILNLYGGDISVKNNSHSNSEGVEFIFTLPL